MFLLIFFCIPFTKICLGSSFIEMGPVVLEKISFKFVNVFLLFRNYLPLKRGVVLHLNKFEFHLPKDALWQVWLKLAQWFLRIWKCEEKYTDSRTDRETDDGRQVIRKAHMSFQLRQWMNKNPYDRTVFTQVTKELIHDK